MAENNSEDAGTYPAPKLNGSSNAGKPLNPMLRHQLETTFNQDLSGINVQVSHEATLRGAKVFSQGNNIFIAPGQEELVPHEAAHAVQQKMQKNNAPPLAKGLVQVNKKQKL